MTDINAWIGCPAITGIRRLAESGRVVVLIDQLDALSDLMDQHSARLGALLQLTAQASRIQGVNVLLSCREFEYQSDLRLRSLDAEDVRLEVPSWEAVEPLLTRAGTSSVQLTGEQREVLRTPQHLAHLDAKARLSGGDSPTYVDDELVDVALTLHHMPETRVAGLDLFERLLTLPAYGISKRLATLDRHAP